MHSMIEARTKNYSQILRLRGKLEIMTSQITSPPEIEDNADTTKEALLVYQDDSSDELNVDDMLMPASDTDGENSDWNAEQDEQESEEESEVSEDEDVVDVDSDVSEEPVANGVESSGDEEEEMDED